METQTQKASPYGRVIFHKFRRLVHSLMLLLNFKCTLFVRFDLMLGSIKVINACHIELIFSFKQFSLTSAEQSSCIVEDDLPHDRSYVTFSIVLLVQLHLNAIHIQLHCPLSYSILCGVRCSIRSRCLWIIREDCVFFQVSNQRKKL